MSQFRMTDTNKPDGFYIQWARVLEPDDTAGAPDSNDDGFWPSHDPDAAGYVAPENYAAEMGKANARMAAWQAGEWWYVGVIAEARCMVVRNGAGFLFNLRSAGLWGVESDAGEYLAEVYEEQRAELRSAIAAMRDPIEEDAP